MSSHSMATILTEDIHIPSKSEIHYFRSPLKDRRNNAWLKPCSYASLYNVILSIGHWRVAMGWEIPDNRLDILRYLSSRERTSWRRWYSSAFGWLLWRLNTVFREVLQLTSVSYLLAVPSKHNTRERGFLSTVTVSIRGRNYFEGRWLEFGNRWVERIWLFANIVHVRDNFIWEF